MDPDVDYAGPLAAMLPRRGEKVPSPDFTAPPPGLGPSWRDPYTPGLSTAKGLAAGAVEPFGQAGRLMTGKSQDTLADIVGAAAAMTPVPAARLGKLAKPAAEAAQAATGGLGDFIKAYHGSPHDFERFDLSKIGTGEGAQVYGHGLYFAENEGVAKEYRDTLAGRPKLLEGPERHAAQALKTFPDRPTAERDLRASAQNMRDLGPKENTAAVNEFDHAADLLAKGWNPATGKMYQVAIKAPPEHFLDWDKPLSEQSEHARNALKRFAISDRNKGAGPTGEQIYDQLKVPRTSQGNSAAATTNLREAGIPGIKYLDQGSRGKEAGTRNYVVFDDKLIDILKKYGIAGIGALPAMNAYHYQDRQ